MDLGDRTRDVGVRAYTDGKAGRITLDRAAALHALNRQMCDAVTTAMMDWMDNDQVEFILIDHREGTRGFCAGGDIAMLSQSGRTDARLAQAFFKAEYRLNSLIASYPKPYIALMDGITMGGGVGLAVHGTYQIATERTVFAMPETGIGLFPDVGGTWFLPRLRGELGTWLALTGAKLKGKDVLAVGLATHFCASGETRALKEDLCKNGLSALGGLRTESAFSQADKLDEIDVLFAGDNALAIRTRLEKGSAWAKSQATKLKAKSPLSTKITLRQLRTGRYLSSLEDALRIEYRIASRLVQSRDFHEGVRASLIDKDFYPRWMSPSLNMAIGDEVAKYFTPLKSGELQFLEVSQ
ncbi:MAG: enoyl-CoA hydratase/isomerase family protein [Pseudomonadota bacterium]